ncbi:MAG: serine/threonine-protein kinase, partial [Cyanobacteria bacterium J06635_10]
MLTDTILRNRYKILKELGRGGFSVTYLAVDMDLPGNPKCVVKQLKTRQSNSTILQIAKKLFEREAQVLYRLGKAHKQIPEMLAHFEENEEFYLVQEFVDGHDLTKEIKQRHRLSEEKVIKLLQEILEVLSFVHENKVIHRDIKLRNIMRRRQDGKIVLIDFGAVKEIKGLAKNEQGDVNSTLIIGTPGYMPDEQANGKPRLCSDVYAVGMLGIQALTGISPRELPFNPDNGELIWRNSADISDRLAEVLTGMVRHHFSQRYQTAAEALKALKSPVILLPKANSAHDTLPDTLASTIRKSPPTVSPVLQTLGLLGLMGFGFGLGVFGWSAFQFYSSNTNKPTLNTTEVGDTVLKNIKPSTTPKTSNNQYPKIFLPSTPRVVDSKTKPIFLPFIPFLNDDRIQRREETSQSISKDKKVKSVQKSKPKTIQPKIQPDLKTSIVKEEKSHSIPKSLTPKPKNNQGHLPSIPTFPYKDKEIENPQTALPSIPSIPSKEDKQKEKKEENSATATPTPTPTPSQSESIDKQKEKKEENSATATPTPTPTPSQS